jgi:hypothetical protein
MAAARRFRIKLSHQTIHRQASGDGVLVGPMRAGNYVALPQRSANARGASLLSLCLMDGSGHSALEKQIVDLLFEHPAKKKLPEQRYPLIVREPAGFRDTQFRHREFKWICIRSKKRAAVTPSTTR